VDNDSSEDAEEGDQERWWWWSQESSVGAKYELAKKGQGCPTNTMIKDENKCKKAAEALQLKWNPEIVEPQAPGGCYATKGKNADFNSIFQNGKKIWKEAQGICFVPGPDVGPSPAPQSPTILEDEFADVLDPEISQLLEESSEEGLNACPPVCDSAFLQRRIKNHENKCFMWACLKCDSFKACDGEKPTDEQANKCSNRCKGFIQKMTQRGKSKPQCAAPDCAFCEGIETKCGAFADR